MNYTVDKKNHWYAVYTYPKVEKRVHSDITELGFESFLPTHTIIRQWSDRKKKVEEPLFPNYVFVRTNLQRRFDILKVPGLVRFITFEGQPLSIPDEQIDQVKSIMSSDSDITCEKYDRKVGEKVLVTNGQFKGIEGVIKNVNGKSRLIIEIEALKQAVSVDISSSNVTNI